MHTITRPFMTLFKEYLIALFNFFLIAQAAPLTLLHRMKIEHIRQMTDNMVKKSLIKVWKMTWRGQCQYRLRTLVTTLQWNANYLLLSLGEKFFATNCGVDIKRFQILLLLLSSYKCFQDFRLGRIVIFTALIFYFYRFYRIIIFKSFK